MGLSAAVDRVLARLASTRLHVLIIATPGAFALRAALERACRARGWAIASSAADADALVVCGSDPSEALTDAVEHLWSSLPGPRARAEITAAAAIQGALDELVHAYRAWDASTDPGSPPPTEENTDDVTNGEDTHEHGRDMGEDEDTHEHGNDMGEDEDTHEHGHDMGEDEHDMGDMGDHDMHMDGDHDMHMDMDMSGPGGIALASGAEDRDGLEMDVLHLPLGPGLVGWPPGLMTVVSLQGDVITEVDVHSAEPDIASDVVAYRLDAAAQLLVLAGADALAAQVGQARDARLGLVPDGPDPAALRRSVERSRVLRWALRRVGQIDAPGERAWPMEWGGDAYDRLLRLLAPDPSTEPEPHTGTGVAIDTATGTDTGPETETDVANLAQALPQLLAGSELATARLTVASLVGLAELTKLTELTELTESPGHDGVPT